MRNKGIEVHTSELESNPNDASVASLSARAFPPKLRLWCCGGTPTSFMICSLRACTVVSEGASTQKRLPFVVLMYMFLVTGVCVVVVFRLLLKKSLSGQTRFIV